MKGQAIKSSLSNNFIDLQGIFSSTGLIQSLMNIGQFRYFIAIYCYSFPKCVV